MKSKYALAAVLVLLIIAFTGISTVFATEYPCYLEIYEKQNSVVVWHFDTVSPGSYSFDGKDITSIQAKYYHAASDTTYLLTPTQVHYSTKGVDLIFKAGSLDILPEQRDPDNDHTYVVGTIAGGDTFIATGPGFTYRPH